MTQALLAFAEDRSIQSDEVAIYFGPTAAPVAVSTEGVVHRCITAELVLATLQKSVVDEPPPPPPVHQAALQASGMVTGGAGSVSSGGAGAASASAHGGGPAQKRSFAAAAAAESIGGLDRSDVDGISGGTGDHSTLLGAADGGSVSGRASVSARSSTRVFPPDPIVRRAPHSHAQVLTQQSDSARGGGSNGERLLPGSGAPAVVSVAVPPISRSRSGVSILDDEDDATTAAAHYQRAEMNHAKDDFASPLAGGDASSRAFPAAVSHQQHRRSGQNAGSARGGSGLDHAGRDGVSPAPPHANDAADDAMGRGMGYYGDQGGAGGGDASPELDADPDSSLLDGHTHAAPPPRNVDGPLGRAVPPASFAQQRAPRPGSSSAAGSMRVTVPSAAVRSAPSAPSSSSHSGARPLHGAQMMWPPAVPVAPLQQQRVQMSLTQPQAFVASESQEF
jgi:hypothetical protein